MDNSTEIASENYLSGYATELNSDNGGRSSVDEVYDIILRRIILGEIVAGEILICTRLADELHVSRTPVVSAIDRLVSDGLLTKEKNFRACVKENTDTWLLQIHHLRQIVEPSAARLAAEYITDEALLKLEKLAELAKPNSNDTWQESAREFDSIIHLSIADHCRNIPLRELIYRCWKFKHISCPPEFADLEVANIKHQEHLAILSALSQHDPGTASVAMMFHLRCPRILLPQRE